MDSTLISYHAEAGELGPLDSPKPILGSHGQVANAADNVIVAPWNRLDILDQIISRNASRIAAVMMEPILCNGGCLLPLPGYLQGVQDLCRRHGMLLVFDEIITGFRVGLGGAQGVYGITPDLGTFGKAMGGGAPISMVAGRKEILNLMFGGGVVFGGTFNGNPMSLAVTLATLTELSRDNGTSLAHANRIGKGLLDGIAILAQKHAIPLTLCGVGAAFALHFTSKTELIEYRDTLEDDAKLMERFLLQALREGIHMLPDGRVYVSAVHTGKEIDETLRSLERVFANLRA